MVVSLSERALGRVFDDVKHPMRGNYQKTLNDRWAGCDQIDAAGIKSVKYIQLWHVFKRGVCATSYGEIY